MASKKGNKMSRFETVNDNGLESARKKRSNLPDKFVVELVVAARGRQEGVAVGNEKVENDGGLKIQR